MMDAVEYLKTLQRLRGVEICTGLRNNNLEEAVALVEQWAKEHPIKTRQSVFLEQWPNAEFDCQGVIAIDPCDVDKTMYGKDGDCYNGECDDCRRKFWLAEVENAETK